MASTGAVIPETYREVLSGLATLPDFDEDVARRLAGFVLLRNVLAHEYIDLRFKRLKRLIDDGASFRALAAYARERFLG